MVANTAPFTSVPARRPRSRQNTSPAAPARPASARPASARLTSGRLTPGRLTLGRLTLGRLTLGRLTLGRLTLGGLARGGLARGGRASGRRWERRIALGLVGGAAMMVPWMIVLARTLPSTARVSNWPMAWIGLDAMIATGMLSTGVLLARRDPRHGLTAAATGALLAMDAWFDVLTSAPGAERSLALAMAAGLELPLACAFAALAARALHTGAPSMRPPSDVTDEEGRPSGSARALRSRGTPAKPSTGVPGEEGRRSGAGRPCHLRGTGVRGVEDGSMKGRWQSIDGSTPDG
ncbi:hypothetical protein [Actinomadura sp. NTSP31]|uniref:hypothetical protein n=1 Tax=Actinomadura sp. NTSP31 TaxID=1735447 RepID=UPI0035C0B157